MRDITHKISTLREAIAEGVIYCSEQTLLAVKNNTLAKGNPYDFARASGFLAAKNTQNLLPHCHPVSIDSFSIDFEYIEGEKNGIKIIATAKSIGRTGIEMEALTAVSIAGLTIYDMLKPLNDTSLCISDIRLLEKKGGKSDRKSNHSTSKCALLVCSDAIFFGKKSNQVVKEVESLLRTHQIEIVDSLIIKDDADEIQGHIQAWVNQKVDFIFTCGGTGLGPSDKAVSVIENLIEKKAEGVVEAIYHFGIQRTPLAMMSRIVAGSIKKTFVLTLPGSSSGAKDALNAVLPHVLHAHKMLLNEGF